MKADKEWLFDFLRTCAILAFIPGLCLLLWVHWALFTVALIAGLIWLTKPVTEKET